MTYKKRRSGIYVRERFEDNIVEAPKMNAEAKGSVLLERLDDDGNVIDSFVARNTITTAGLNRIMASIIEPSGIFRGTKLQLTRSATATNAAAVQDATLHDGGNAGGANMSFRGLFPKEASLGRVTNVVFRQSAAPFDIYAYARIQDLTRTTTSGTNPFVSGTTKGINDAWRVTWRLGWTLTGAALSAQEIINLNNQLEQYIAGGSSQRYLGAAPFTPYIFADFRASVEMGRPASNFTWRPWPQSLQTSVAGGVLTVAVTAPGPTPDRTADRNSFNTGLFICERGQTAFNGAGRSLGDNPSRTNTDIPLYKDTGTLAGIRRNWGAGTQGGTFTVTITATAA